MTNALKTYAANDAATRVRPARQTRVTSQRARTPGRTDEVQNYAGGYVFKVSDRARLERFLILGTDKGLYTVNAPAFTRESVKFVSKYIAKAERDVIDVLVDVATNNRAAKNSPSLYALALVLSEGKDKAYLRATDVVNKVVRTSTHLFEFANYIDSLGGWGRAKRSAIASWYEGKDANQIAYQAIKYRQREGWTHRDLFRKVHPVGIDQTVGNFILGKDYSAAGTVLDGFSQMQHARNTDEVIRILNTYTTLPWETIPTNFLTDAEVWKTLFYNGALGQTALLRNATRFSKIGAFNDIVFTGDVAKALADTDRIIKGRVHPVAYANALGIYRNGKVGDSAYGYGSRGARSKDWTTNAKIAGAIEAGFYESFGTIKPANKATMVSVDVSGSMTWDAPAGLVGMNYMEAAAVMAMVTVRTEPYAVINAFSTYMQDVNVSDTDSLETVINRFRQVRMGDTDVAQPMLYAKDSKIGVDTFAVYTDNETWAGKVKPSQALVQYRQATGRNARLAVVALAGSDFTVADPKDPGMMDFVGFDSAAPAVLADFSAGRI